jgi:hypothetical protein
VGASRPKSGGLTLGHVGKKSLKKHRLLALLENVCILLIHMNIFTKKAVAQRVILICSLLALTGCASQSGKTFATLDRSNPAFKSSFCQQTIRETEIHDDFKLLRSLLSPVAVVLSGGTLFPAVVVANAGFDTADRVDASRMDERCGGQAHAPIRIAEDVVRGVTIDLLTTVVVGASGIAEGAGIASAAK